MKQSKRASTSQHTHTFSSSSVVIVLGYLPASQEKKAGTPILDRFFFFFFFFFLLLLFGSEGPRAMNRQFYMSMCRGRTL